VRVAFLSSPFGTPRHRCQHPCEQLQGQGIEAAVLEGEAPSLSGYSHAVLNRVPLSAALAESIAAAERSGTRVLFDVDDLIFDPAVVAGMEFVKKRPAPDRTSLLEAVEGIARTIERCRAGLCATPALRRELASRGQGARVALNGVSDEMVRLSEQAFSQRSGDARVVRIGFAGGHPGHAFNLPVAEDALATLLHRHAQLELVLIGPIEPPPRLRPWADRVEQVPFVDWRRLPFELARLDVCIAPLADNAFNRCKSDVKFLEAALARVAVVASPVGQLGESIHHGVNGLLAEGTEAWTEALSSLVEQPRLRAELAEAAREQVLRERTSGALGPALVEALRAAAGEEPSRRSAWLEGPHGSAAPGWLALSDDELLYQVEALTPGHDQDRMLVDVVRSDRHFFIRQEAAKKVGDADLLKAWSGDRHIGQVLVRVMKRAEDVAYLERLRDETRHLEVRKAAEAQLDIIRASRDT